jgi:hypothetical protein
MEYGIKNNRRGHVRVSGSLTVVLDPGLNKLTKEQYDHVRARAANFFEAGRSGTPVLEEVKVPAERPAPQPKAEAKNERPAQPEPKPDAAPEAKNEQGAQPKQGQQGQQNRR